MACYPPQGEPLAGPRHRGGRAARSRRVPYALAVMAGALRTLIGGAQRIAMEVSLAARSVSAGGRGHGRADPQSGRRVVTSADLVQVAEAVWTLEQLTSHRRAAAALIEVKDATFGHVRERLAAGLPVTECGVQDFMMAQFASRGMEADHPPIVGVNEHAADPHYSPRRDADTPLHRATSCSSTWTKEPGPTTSTATSPGAYAGPVVPSRMVAVFETVRESA